MNFQPSKVFIDIRESDDPSTHRFSQVGKIVFCLFLTPLNDLSAHFKHKRKHNRDNFQTKLIFHTEALCVKVPSIVKSYLVLTDFSQNLTSNFRSAF